MTQASVDISAIGLASSLGPARAGCAAARAGIARTAELDFATAEDPLVGHPLREVTDGFAGIGRHWRMCDLALSDLCANGQLGEERGETALFLHVGDNFYEVAATAMDLDGEAQAIRDRAQELMAEEQAAFQQSVEQILLPRIGARLEIAPTRQFLTAGGPARFYHTLAAAIEQIRTGAARRCIVGAVDSLIDPVVLNALQALDLLKSDENPVGLAPGECAAFFAIEATTNPDRPALASIEGIAHLASEAHRFSGYSPDGEEIAEVIRGSFAQLVAPPAVEMAIGNLNGDVYRAQDFGNALVKLAGWGLPHAFASEFPAASFGDTGASVVALSICMATRAFARNYSRGGQILVWSASDDGERGSCIVGHPRDASAIGGQGTLGS